jgi:hypothetical protein
MRKEANNLNQPEHLNNIVIFQTKNGKVNIDVFDTRRKYL